MNKHAWSRTFACYIPKAETLKRHCRYNAAQDEISQLPEKAPGRSFGADVGVQGADTVKTTWQSEGSGLSRCSCVVHGLHGPACWWPCWAYKFSVCAHWSGQPDHHVL